MPDNPLVLFLYILAGAVGLCLGSFATALVYRIPRNIPWIYDRAATSNNKVSRSACPSCGHVLSVRDLVPLFSWLLSRGRCRHCGAGVSARYPLTELVTMFLVLLLFHVWGFSPVSVPLFLAVPFLVAGLLIDWDHMILPDDINLSLFALALVHLFCMWHMAGGALPVVADAFVAAVLLTVMLWLVSAVLSKWKGRPALGMGDLKFLPAAGLLLGTAALPSYLALSGVLGLLTAALKAGLSRDRVFPFGPALIISLYIHVFLTGLGFDYKW